MNVDNPKCVVCSKEIMAGKRCIECFMNKEEVKKKPSREEQIMDMAGLSFGNQGQYLTTGSTMVSTTGVEKTNFASCETGYPRTSSGTSWTSIDTSMGSPPAVQAHTLTATETTDSSGRITRTYRAKMPDGF